MILLYLSEHGSEHDSELIHFYAELFTEKTFERYSNYDREMSTDLIEVYTSFLQSEILTFRNEAEKNYHTFNQLYNRYSWDKVSERMRIPDSDRLAGYAEVLQPFDNLSDNVIDLVISETLDAFSKYIVNHCTDPSELKVADRIFLLDYVRLHIWLGHPAFYLRNRHFFDEIIVRAIDKLLSFIE